MLIFQILAVIGAVIIADFVRIIIQRMVKAIRKIVVSYRAMRRLQNQPVL